VIASLIGLHPDRLGPLVASPPSVGADIPPAHVALVARPTMPWPDLDQAVDDHLSCGSAAHRHR